ncbi:MAG: diacylglycerol kinase family protein [Alphaproteobacteria bacterium]
MAGRRAPGMIRLGVVSNPRSGRNRRRGLGVAADAARRADAPHVVLDSMTDLPAIMATFARQGVGVIVIDGGDGTVRSTIAAALAEPGFSAAPRFAALGSGTTNMVAGDVGVIGAPGAAFARLADRAKSGDLARHVVERRLLAVETGARSELGFFLGAGAIVWGTRFTRRHIERGRLVNGLGSVLGVTATVGRLLLGGARGPLAAGTPMAVGYDDAQPLAGARLLLAVTTLDRLLLGLRPFWGTGPGALRTLDIAAPPRRCARGPPAPARGRPRPWMAEAGYRSLNADRITIEIDDDVLIDGEWCRASPGRPLVLKPGAAVGFVRP